MRRASLAASAAGLFALVATLVSLSDGEPFDDMELGPFVGLRWWLLPFIAVLSVLHFVFAAIALRAAAGRPLPLVRTVMVQFTAAAANRVAPAGLGAAAVNTRFLTNRGLTVSGALAAVGLAHMANGFVRLVLGLVVLLIGHWTGGGLPVMSLAARAPSIAVNPMVVAGLAAALVVVVALAVWCRRRARRSGRVAGCAAGCLAHAREMLHRPRDIVVMLAACLAVVLSLGGAFVLSVLAVPGAAGPKAAPALLAAYLIGTAGASAIPVPAGIGSTEFSLTAMLGAAKVPLSQGLQSVLVFRVITYWAPVPIGLLTGRAIKRCEPAERPAEKPAISKVTAPVRVSLVREPA